MCNKQCDCINSPCKICAEKELILCVDCSFFRDLPNIPQGGICTKKIGVDSHKLYENSCRHGERCVVY